ncbi:nuclear exosome regulator NRDE2 [Trichonephila clavipes]|nr:nuclear exosome regulator NRDE2 [Trichonephila clavipes]
MEVNNQSQIPTTRAPLFPAYSVQSVEKEDAQNNKEWLCNSSYSPADHTEVFMQAEEKELPKEEIYLKETKDKIKRESKKSKKKKEHKKYPIPTPESFQVPESDSIRSQLNKKTFIEETGLSFERAFRVDPKGDFENRYYEHLEQKHIAKYKVYPRIPIGCKLEEQSLWIQPLPKIDVPRYFSKKARKLLLKTVGESENCTLTKPEVSDNIFSYIPLESKSSKSSNSAHNYIKANFDGVSTSWKAEFLKAPEVKEDNFNEKQIDSELNLELKHKTTLFNKKLSESPNNIQLWLDFVDFQEELYYSQKMEEANKALPESYLTEKKVAILDKALKHNPQNVQLNIAKLNLCRSLWTIDTVIRSWEQLIFLYPNNAQIWREYTIFVQTNITYFNTTRLLKVFRKCIKTLSDLSEGVMQSHEAPPDIIDIMIDIFAQLCFVLKSCGFTEKAIAAYQGLIEFNLFGLSTTESLSVSEQIPCLEPFWDSGAPRFGEDDAIGWSETIEQKKISFNKIVTQSDLSNMEDDILYQKLPEWRIWLEFEKLRESHYWLPWRPNPEYDQTADDIDDLNRIISFDDISHFIFRIQNEEHKFLLYFTQGLDAAILVFKELSESVNEKVTDAYKRYILEQICVSQAELLNFHTRNSTVSIKPLLLYLYNSVKQYPNNIKLLHILVRWKSASAVVGPTRRFFCNILKEPYKADPVTWIFALASELSISYSISVWSNSNSDMQLFEAPPSSTGIKWKIRSIYEKALNSASCANIPILWRSYMKFEMINNETEKCKGIYHRALQNCGWSKELILDCVEYFPDDLKQILDFVEEKVIRIHTPIEEINLLVKHVAQL